jgi:serum/glucocorticoid-regulated kinase 2
MPSTTTTPPLSESTATDGAPAHHPPASTKAPTPPSTTNHGPSANLRAVLGLAPASPRVSTAQLSARKSADLSASSPASPSTPAKRKKARAQESSAVDDAFFEVPDPRTPAPPAENVGAPGSLPARRAPLRMDAQDGPWSISVAEHPHNARAYTLYIKSTSDRGLYTLTRTDDSPQHRRTT